MRRKFLIGGLVLALIGGCFAFMVWSVAPLWNEAPIIPSTKILDREGGLLYELARTEEGRRSLVSLDELPESFLKAVVASEDKRFYQHQGIDGFALVRVLGGLVSHGRILGGASTLEQQIVKNLYFLGESRTVFQKVREMIAATYWSSTHTKDETLEAYVNTIFFGNQANGVEAASQTYFHKSAQDLTLAESAMLVGMIPLPSAADPSWHWHEAKERQRLVLDRMVLAGAITESERTEALATSIDVFRPRYDIRAPHFVFHVLEELTSRYPDLREGGYTVRTTLDPELQESASEAVMRQVVKLIPQNVTNGAAIALDPERGGILAYVGSRDFFNETIQGQVDMVSARRQPGSALKPFLYFQAFLQGFTPASIISDLPVRFETAEGKSYYPRNYGYKYSGPVSFRDALGSSLNIPAVKILDKVGLTSFVGLLARFGVRFPEPPDHYGLGLVLGGGETTLQDVAFAYARLALYGKSVEPVDVLEIRDRSGRVLESAQPQVHTPLFDDKKAEGAAWLVSDILSDKLARAKSFGEANLLDTGKRIAVKTGTTKDFRDNWAFGYTPNFVLGIWVGNADNSAMEGVSGITGAVPIWNEIMRHRFAGERTILWPTVSGLVQKNICTISGLLADEDCLKTRTETFLVGTEPTEPDDWYIRCRSHGIMKTFLKPPEEYAAWFVSTGYESAPSDCGREGETTDRSLVILSPLDGDLFERDTLLDLSGLKIPFMAGGNSQPFYRWKLNGHPFESHTPTFLWEPVPGTYTLELEGTDRSIRFRVQ